MTKKSEAAIASGNYIGTVNGVEVELRQPTLDDMPALEELLSSRGYDLSQMDAMPKTELIYTLFILLCNRFGTADGVTREELGRLPMKAFMEVSEAVSNFRDIFGV